MIKVIGLLFLSLVISCTSIPKENSIVLNYGDFGPQVIASEIIGMAWWQWQDHGDSRPRKYDIKVVVYNDASLTLIKDKYPVDSSKESDYRYLECKDAQEYLKQNIRENILSPVTDKLKVTSDILSKRLCNF